MRVAVDGRELCRDELNSLGLFLKALIELIANEAEVLVLVPVAMKTKITDGAIEVRVRGREFRNGLGLLGYHRWMRRMVKESRPDIFYEINHYLPFKMPGTISVTTIHDLYVLHEFNRHGLAYRLMYKMLVARTLRNSTIVIARSKATLEELRSVYHVQREIFVNPHAVSVEEPGQDRELGGRGYILCLGRVNRWKGIDRVVELYVGGLFESGLELVLAGPVEDQALGRQIEDLIQAGHRITVTGYVSDDQRNRLVANCDLFLYPSRYDGFGVPPLEAAILRRRMVVNDIPVLHESLGDEARFVDFYAADDVVIDSLMQALADEEYPFELLRQRGLEFSIQNSLSGARKILASYLEAADG